MNLTEISSKIIIWAKENYALLIGSVVVLILAATTFHSDITYISIVSQKIANGGFDIYTNYFIDGKIIGAPIMPPLIFLFDGFIFWLLKLIGILNFSFVINNLPIWQFFLLKLRYFIIFVLSYFLIYKVGLNFTNDKKQAKIISFLWITSPILLYLPFTQGNNDIYPVFFTLIFLLFAFKKENVWAMIFLGLAAAMKNYAVFLFIPMALILAEKNIKKTIYYLIAAGTAFVLPSLFYLQHVLNFGSGGGEGLLMLKTVITSEVSFMLFPMAYFATILYLFFANNEKELKENNGGVLAFYGFLIMSLFFSLEFYIPQWFLWILPFFVLVIYKNRKLFWLYTIATAAFLFSIATNWVNNIDVNLFRPIMGLAPNAKIFTLSPNVFRSQMMYSAFASVMLVFTYFLIKNYSDKTKEDMPNLYVFWNMAPLLAYLAMMALFIILSIKGIQIKLP